MDVVLLLIMAAPGLCAVSSQTERRVYHFYSEEKTWTEAQSYCREKHTDLATVDNMEDVKTLNNTADKRSSWIGLYSDVMSWKWSLSDTSFYKQGEREYRRWSSSEPTPVENGEHCSTMHMEISNDNVWIAHHCHDIFMTVCSYVRGLNVTFIRVNIPMTWTKAQSYCRANYTDLAIVRNETENQKVAELLTAPGDYFWIGLFRDSWKWSDGSYSSFRYWRQGQPIGASGTCAAANFGNSGRWEDLNCDSSRSFVCYSVEPVSKVNVMKVRFERKNSSLDLNDPAVMEAILTKLKQKLKDQGVNDNIKLSWKKHSDGKVFHKEEKKTKKKTKDEF